MDGKRASKGAIIALACTTLMLFVPNYSQYQLSPIAHLIMPAYDLDATQFSILFSSTMIAGILLSLVAGLLSDRFGVKRVVGIAAIISVTALVARIFAPNFATLFVCMALAGVVATFLNANLAKIMGSWFPPEKVGLAVGIGLAGATFSMAIGLGTSALFPSLKAIFTFTAVVAIIALAAWWLFFKDGPGGMQASPEPDSAGASLPKADGTPLAQPSLSECLKVVLKSRNVWLIGVALGMDMAATMCIVTFLPQVLQATRGFDPTAAGALSSVVTFGNLAGSILAPIILACVGRFKPVAIVLAIISAAGTAFAWQLPDGPFMLVCFFMTGFALSGLMTVLVSAVVLLPEIGPVYAGTAGGVGATLQLFGAVVIPSYILMPILGENWPVFYGIGGILCIVAAVCVFLLPEVLKREW
ncbi:MAG: MFS transporter [Eggerthellaceae bacterium]|nr:MFS transporter [Eggerthellaceae bacterium]